MKALDEFSQILRPQQPLAPLTWLQLGGPAEYLAEPRDQDELSALVSRCYDAQIAVRLLGGGANVLIPDAGVPGVVVQLTSEMFTKVRTQKSHVTVGGGAKLSQLVTETVRQGLAGLETLAGIPGTVGGAAHGNAGGRGGDIGQWIRKATVMTKTGEVHERNRDDLVFAYRQSSLDELVILSVEFELAEDDPQELTKRMQKQWIVTKANQPLSHQPCACAFKNPRGMSAGMLIEQAGLKGTRVGGAEISERYTNFLTVEPEATSEDVRTLLQSICQEVQTRLGVVLEPELQIW